MSRLGSPFHSRQRSLILCLVRRLRMPAGFGDYTLTSYVVQCDRAEIRLRAREPHSDTPKETEIIFHGVAAYHFENDNFGTILGWIIEHPLKEFIAEHAEQFARGSKSS